MSTTYFLFTVRSSSLRLGCGQKHKPVTDPELRGVAVAAISTDHSHQAPSALPPRGPHLLLGKETDARRASKPQVPPHRFIALPGNAASGAPAKAWRAAQAAAASLAGPGRAGERAESGARPEPLRGRGQARALPPRTCVGVSPEQVASAPPSAPNLLNSRDGRPAGRAGKRAAAPAGAHDAAEGPTWRSPPPPPAHRAKPSGLRPGALPKNPPAARTRKR